MIFARHSGRGRPRSLIFEPPRRDVAKALLAQIMPPAGIVLRPSLVRSIHARAACPRPITRVQNTIREDDANETSRP
jgi:hypothetical protein